MVFSSPFYIIKLSKYISSLDVEKLLSSPIKKYQHVDIKFKRTKQIIDKTSFLLQTPIDNEEDKIDSSRIKLYVERLIGNKNSTNFDISSDSEQIIFVLCNDELGKFV